MANVNAYASAEYKPAHGKCAPNIDTSERAVYTHCSVCGSEMTFVRDGQWLDQTEGRTMPASEYQCTKHDDHVSLRRTYVRK